MGDDAPQPVFRCAECSKPFDKESSLKSHGYYCRSRRGAGLSKRPRSCLACAKSKARCNKRLFKCSRCATKSLECQYPINNARHATSAGPLHTHPQDVSTPMVLDIRGAENRTPSSSDDNPLEFDSANNGQPVFDLSSVAGNFLGLDWGLPEIEFTNIVDVDNLSTPGMTPLLGQMPGNQNPPPCARARSPSIPRPLMYNIRSLSKRPNTGPAGQIITNLMLRIVNSYPKMMMNYDALPPFIHPQWIAAASDNPRMESLTNCVSLVRMFGSGAAGSSKLFWRNVRSECQRLTDEYASYDKTELIATSQALVVYMLVRLAEGETEHNNSDALLLNTINMVLSYLCNTLGNQPLGVMDYGMGWRDWIFEESRRRMSVLFRIVDMLVFIETSPARGMESGLVISPLPARKQLWEARTEVEWMDALMGERGGKTDFGMTANGELVALDVQPLNCPEALHEPNRHEGASGTNWEEWCSGMDGFGALVMLAASLQSL